MNRTTKKYKEGTLVQINSGKSKFKEAIDTVIGYCNGDYPNICRVKLWKNKIINVFDFNLKEYKS